MNDNDSYIRSVVAQHTPNIGYVVQDKINELLPHIHAWANGYQYQVKLSGSLAKGTGITGTTDMDLFISLEPSVNTCNTHEDVYQTLRNRFDMAGYTPREQNVSIGINHSDLKMDLVAGVKHHPLGSDHSIWKRKARTWTKTNIDKHIDLIKLSGRTSDIRAIKIWRKLKQLDFPSFYLELSVLEALKGRPLLNASPAENFIRVMHYLANDFVGKTIEDPANQSNKVSHDLTLPEKQKIRDTALTTLAGPWSQAIW